MTENDDLKKQIAQLQATLQRHSQNNSAHPGALARYSYSRPHYQRPRPPNPYRYNPLRPSARPSRNMKLFVQHASPGKVESEATGQSDKVQYVTSGNKLVRVGSGAPSISAPRPRPQYRPMAAASNSMHKFRPSFSSKRLRKVARSIVIDGETYIRRGIGNKLVLSSLASTTQVRPNVKASRIVSIEGENYIRTKRGTLIRVGALRTYTKKRNLTLITKNFKRPRRLCVNFLYDRCENSAEKCRLSHELTPETVPLCVHFQRDRCAKEDCKFIHIKRSPDIPICHDFVYKGFCAKGLACPDRHIRECPEWTEKGKCSREKCKLPHPKPHKEGIHDDEPEQTEKKDTSMKRYIEWPPFDKADEVASITSDMNTAQDAVAEPTDLTRKAQEDEEEGNSGAESEDDGDDDLSEDLSEDEAEELLKWYDDNVGETPGGSEAVLNE